MSILINLKIYNLMKKLFTLSIIMMFAAIVAAQTSKRIHLWDHNVTGDVKQGDSLFINVKFDSDFTSADSTKFQLWPTMEVIYKASISDLQALPKEADGTTTIKFKIPDNATVGASKLYVKYQSWNPL